LFARCFEAFISDSLDAKGRKNTYLVNGTEHSTDHPGFMPGGEHRKRIAVKMEALIKALHAENQFEKAAWGEWLDDLQKSRNPRLWVTL
jgi:hypothetical protein